MRLCRLDTKECQNSYCLVFIMPNSRQCLVDQANYLHCIPKTRSRLRYLHYTCLKISQSTLIDYNELADVFQLNWQFFRLLCTSFLITQTVIFTGFSEFQFMIMDTIQHCHNSRKLHYNNYG